IPKSKLEFSTFENVHIWQEIAEVLLKKYIDKYYLYEKNKDNSDNVEAILLNGEDDNFIYEYDFQLNSEEEIEQYKFIIENLKDEVFKDDFSELKIGQEAVAFDNPLHLYKPIIYLDGKRYKDEIKVSPVALN